MSIPDDDGAQAHQLQKHVGDIRLVSKFDVLQPTTAVLSLLCSVHLHCPACRWLIG
jgi:hypothetical protein